MQKCKVNTDSKINLSIPVCQKVNTCISYVNQTLDHHQCMKMIKSTIHMLYCISEALCILPQQLYSEI